MRIIHEVLPHQKKVLLSDTYITSMSCGIGAGKSHTAALINIMHQLKGKRTLVIMPTKDSVKKVHNFHMKKILNSWKLPYRENKTNGEICVGTGTMIAKTEENADTINGLTDIDTVIIDECRFISEITFTYAISRQRGGIDAAKVYLFGTGCSKRTWFAKASMNPKATWVSASMLDNIKHNKQDYIDRMLEEYKGQEQYFIDRELYGKFVDGDEQSLFQEINLNAAWKPGRTCGGLDLAINGGSDYSAAAIFSGNKLIYLGKKKTLGMPAAQRWLNELKAVHGCNMWYHDHTGLGKDLVLEGSNEILFGNTGIAPYGSKRTEMYFALKSMLADGIFVESQEYRNMFKNEVEPELEATKTIDREMRHILLIPKKEIKDVIGHSPDLSDALALAAYAGKYCDSDIDVVRLRQMQHMNNPFRTLR